VRLADLLDVSVLTKLAEANYKASGMPIGIVDADGSVLVGFGWQDICTMYHRANAITAERCRESDEHIARHVAEARPCEYTCRNGLRDIGVPITVGGKHLATLFLGQFFYEGETPDREFFAEQARQFGFAETAYLAALDRVPVFSRASVENILTYNTALARIISDLAEGSEALRERDDRLRAAMQRLESLLENSPLAVIEWSSDDFRIARWSDEAARMFGFSAEETVGKPIHELPLVYPEDWPLVEQAMTLMLSGTGPRNVSRNRNVRKDGQIIHCEWYNSTVTDASGKLGSVLSLVLDVTDRKRVEHELRAANRAKDEFLSMLSHELRNPLAPIRSSLFVLDHAEPGGQQARRAKEVAGRQLGHLTRLVDDLLDVTRIVRGKAELRLTRLDVSGLVRRTGEDHRALMRERGLRFGVDAPEAPAWVEGDETRLAQVVGNLLQNAAKFTPDGGAVRLAVVAQHGVVEIRVRDTGHGIDPELLPHVFEPFVQAKQSLARTEGGLGLGLALARGLVQLHGGTIEARSGGRDQGAEFTVRLALLALDPAASDRDDAVASTAVAERRRVLVVDDNRDAAESLAEFVEILGHQVDVAFDGNAAVEAAKANVPDVVLCDIGLPGLSGYDVARALRSDHRFDRVQLIAVTGYAEPEDRQRAFDAGFEAHIPKPPDLARVESLLRARRG
jgi:PAS domain S-box-containing protein